MYLSGLGVNMTVNSNSSFSTGSAVINNCAKNKLFTFYFNSLLEKTAILKGTVHPKSKIHSLPVELFISLDCFGVSCLVLKISAVEVSAFSQL